MTNKQKRIRAVILLVVFIAFFYGMVAAITSKFDAKAEAKTAIKVNPVAVVPEPEIVLENRRIVSTPTIAKQPVTKANTSKKARYLAYVKKQCKLQGVYFSEAKAIIAVENPGMNPESINKNTDGSRDIGIFQINERSFPALHKKLGTTDLSDPYQNIRAGIYKIKCLDNYKGHTKYMAYNMGAAGMKSAVSRGIYQTRYSRKVIKNIKRQK